MAKKIVPQKENKKIAYIIAAILLGIILLGSIISKPTKEAEANEGSGTWSGGYRYYYDMDESDDRQVGKDLNQFERNPDDDGVIFFEQEWKF
jgi:hypothetical protein